MTASLAGTVYALAGLAFAAILVDWRNGVVAHWRGFAIWALLVPVLFFLADQGVVLLLAAVIMAVLGPLSPRARVALFLVVASSLPVYIEVPISLPGVQTLAVLTAYKVTAVAILLPILVLGGRLEPAAWKSLAVWCLAGLALYQTAIVAGATNVTSGLRFLLDQFILFLLPLIVIAAVIRNADDLTRCLKALVVASAIFGALAFVVTAKQWDFYRLHAPPSVMHISDFRSGFLRVEVTTNTHSLGYHLALGLLFIEVLKRHLGLGFMRRNLLRAVLLLGIFVTDSRGAMLSLAVAMAFYYFLVVRSAGLRMAMVGVLLAALLGGMAWFVVGDFSRVDQHGTFGYRQQLLLTSLEFIADYPLFGHFGFLTTGRFDHLVQGQGIVDVTNLYLQIALQFGLIGLALFLVAYGTVAIGLLRLALSRQTSDAPGTVSIQRIAAALSGALFGWLVLVATTSNVGMTMHIGITLLALGQAACIVGRRQKEGMATVSKPARSRRRHRLARTLQPV